MSGRTYAEVSFTSASHGERLGDMAMPLRLVREHAGDYPTEWAAITEVSSRLGMSSETLRKWVRSSRSSAHSLLVTPIWLGDETSNPGTTRTSRCV